MKISQTLLLLALVVGSAICGVLAQYDEFAEATLSRRALLALETAYSDKELTELREAREIRAMWVDELCFDHAALYTYGMPTSLGYEIEDPSPFKIDKLKGPPDGMGAYKLDEDTVRLIVQSEIGVNDGYAYTLTANPNVTLYGSVVQYLDLRQETPHLLEGSGLIYDNIMSIDGVTPIKDGYDLIFSWGITPEAEAEIRDPEEGYMTTESGIVRLCSGSLSEAYPFGPGIGSPDRIFFANQESGNIYKHVGATVTVTDIENAILYQLPQLGFGVTEKTEQVSTGETEYVAYMVANYGGAAFSPDTVVELQNRNITIGDGQDIDHGDFELLYVGKKDMDGDFLARNGFRNGQIYIYTETDGNFTYDHCDQMGETFPGIWKKLPWRFDYADVTNVTEEELQDYYMNYMNEAVFAEAVTSIARGATHNGLRSGKSEHMAVSPIPTLFQGEVVPAGQLAAKALTNADAIGLYDLRGIEAALTSTLSDGADFPDEIESSFTILVPCEKVFDEEGNQVGYKGTYINDPDSLYWLGDGRMYVGEDSSAVADKFVSFDVSALTEPEAMVDGELVGDAVPALIGRLSGGSLSLFDTDNIFFSPEIRGRDPAEKRANNYEVSGTIDMSGVFRIPYNESLPTGYYGYELQDYVDGSVIVWGIQLHAQTDDPVVARKGQLVISQKLDSYANLFQVTCV